MLTKQEAKVSTMFLACVWGLLFGGALTRILTQGHLEGGSFMALAVGALFMVWTVIHVGLED